jgi:hypothetical protein
VIVFVLFVIVAMLIGMVTTIIPVVLRKHAIRQKESGGHE